MDWEWYGNTFETYHSLVASLFHRLTLISYTTIFPAKYVEHFLTKKKEKNWIQFFRNTF